VAISLAKLRGPIGLDPRGLVVEDLEEERRREISLLIERR